MEAWKKQVSVVIGGGNWAVGVLLIFLSLAGTDVTPGWVVSPTVLCVLPGNSHCGTDYRMCDVPGFWTVLQPLIPWQLLSERASCLRYKGLICNMTSTGLSLRGSVRFADWCAFWKCFSAKLALINKIYEGKQKLALPSWVFFVLMTNLHVQDL